MTITLEPSNTVVRRTLKASRAWFNQIGRFLNEGPNDPIALITPSVIVPEYNAILYPRRVDFEPEFVRIESVRPFEFDTRNFNEHGL